MNRNKNRKIIAWDRDKTLGEFSRIFEFERMKSEGIIPDNKVLMQFPNGTKPGIHKLLADLESEGFEHYITSRGTEKCLERVLKDTGLKGFFKKQFGRETISDYAIQLIIPTVSRTITSKSYKAVIKEAKMTEEEAKNNMLIIGDRIYDQPCDINEVVFIHYNRCCDDNSQALKEIIQRLMEEGDGSFNKGFSRIYKNSQEKEAVITKNFECDPFYNTTPFFKYCTVYFGNITADLEYRILDSEHKQGIIKIPTITRINAGTYLRKIVPIKKYITLQETENYEELELNAEEILKGDKEKAQKIIRGLNNGIKLLVESDLYTEIGVKKTSKATLELYAKKGIIEGICSRVGSKVFISAMKNGNTQVIVPTNIIFDQQPEQYFYVAIQYKPE